MKRLKERELYIVLLILNFVLFFRILEKSYKIRDFSYFFILFYIAIGIGIHYFYSKILKKKSYRAAFTFCVIVAIAIFCYYKRIVVQNFVFDFSQQIWALNDDIYNYRDTSFTQFKIIFGLAIPILTILMFHLALKGFINITLLLNGGIMIAFWYGMYTEEIKKLIPPFLFVSLLTYSLNGYVKKVRRLKLDGIEMVVELKRTVVTVLILAFFMTLVVGTMPQEYKGNLYVEGSGNLVNKFNEIREENDPEKKKYNLTYSGYNDTDKILGGPISLNSNPVLKVKSDKPYYLRGNVKDFYDGRSWRQTIKKYVKIKDEEVLNAKYMSDLGMNKKWMEIEPLVSESSSTLFSPNFSTNVSPEKGQGYYDQFGSTFQNSRVNTKNYKVEFWNGNEDMSLLGILGKEGRMNYDIVHNVNREPIPNEYLQLPSKEKIPDAYNLAYEITKDCNTNFEKVEKIQAYLSKNYHYSLEVSDIPKNTDFLTYFLFTEKKGYCTYFATATTLMCRMVGVPARYVEGFKMSNRMEGENVYLVTNEDAHAWAEILVDPKQGLWGIVDPATTPTEQRQREEEEQRVQQQESSNLPIANAAARKKRIQEEEGGGSTEKAPAFELGKKEKAAIAVSAFVLLWIGMRQILIVYKKKKILRTNSVIPLYIYIMQRLKRIYIRKAESIAELEFLDTIQDKELKGRLEPVIEAVYKEHYGGKKEENLNLIQIYDFIESYIKKKQGKVKYYFKRFIFWQ